MGGDEALQGANPHLNTSSSIMRLCPTLFVFEPSRPQYTTFNSLQMLISQALPAALYAAPFNLVNLHLLM
jgi:hypothetical protein